MTLKEAVETLEGPQKAAKASGIGRTVIEYWLANGAPKWRASDVQRLIDLANLKKTMPNNDGKAA